MSDGLHKYPGNLKHHKVDAPKRDPLFTDAAVELEPEIFDARYIRDIYEAARAKDAELIQMAYNALLAITDESCGQLERLGIAHSALDSLTAEGYKPTQAE